MLANLILSDENLCKVLAMRPTACAVERNFVFVTTRLAVFFQILIMDFKDLLQKLFL